jgi:acyl-coenzyme A synthetase/AMP-(fatty) acid ligase
MYGLTEAFRSTYLPPDQVDKRPDSIGKAIPNVSIHVINDEGKECAPGEAGELIHRGALIAKGYWGDPEKTAQVYRPNPLLPPHLRFTEKVVYSGDLARKDEEGYLYFIGRRDNMLKSSGHRISPDEITETLLRMKGVQNAAVIGIDDEHLGYKIAAFLQVEEAAPITEQDCIQFAKKFLPPHMIPSIVMCMHKFPQNANGKVDLLELKKQVMDANKPL